MTIAILNGPNLNLLGQREPEIYGTQTLSDMMQQLAVDFPNVTFVHHQSNLEGDLVNWVQQYGFHAATRVNGIIINPGGYSHTSVAIADAIAAATVPVAEAHISNIHAREPHRHTSLTGAQCKGIVTGFGYSSYWMAVSWMLKTKV